MKLSFRTRDAGVGNDYPNIGWLPGLPPGADRLWTRFGDCQSQEYPQFVLSSKNGAWTMYLEGLDSGRNDALSGVGGRVVRNSLCFTGTAADADAAFLVASVFVRDLTVEKTFPQKTFREASLKTVAPGEARGVKNGGEVAQAEKAEALLGAIVMEASASASSSTPVVSSVMPVRSGLTAEGKEAFLSVCRALLSGTVPGCAVALATARLSEANRVESLAGERLLGFLSLDERDVPASSKSPAGPVFPARYPGASVSGAKTDSFVPLPEPENKAGEKGASAVGKPDEKIESSPSSDAGWNVGNPGTDEKGKFGCKLKVGGAMAVVGGVLLFLFIKWMGSRDASFGPSASTTAPTPSSGQLPGTSD